MLSSSVSGKTSIKLPSCFMLCHAVLCRVPCPAGQAETIFQRAILEQGRGRVLDTLAEIQERNRAVKDLEASLLELHQIFLDMAVLVEAQGEMLDNIEKQVRLSGANLQLSTGLNFCARHTASAQQQLRVGEFSKACVTLSLRCWPHQSLLQLAVAGGTQRGICAERHNSAGGHQAAAEEHAQVDVLCHHPAAGHCCCDRHSGEPHAGANSQAVLPADQASHSACAQHTDTLPVFLR
jgi:hypothetical protein